MLTKAKNIKRREREFRDLPVKSASVIIQGGLVVMSGAFATKGITALSLIAIGIAQADADNTSGADGAISVSVRTGCFAFVNSAGAAVDRSHIGKTVYIEDDETIASTDGGGTRSAAGVCFDVDSSGVWVTIG